MRELLDRLERAFREAADPAKAPQMSAYMKNRFPFFGIQAGPRRQIARRLTRSRRDEPGEIEILMAELWSRPEREYQYFGCDYLALHRKRWWPGLMDTFEFMIVNKSWWDTVDAVASLVGDLGLDAPQTLAVVERWSDAESMWLNRTALIYQRKYRGKTDSARLFRYIEKMLDCPEFFIRKAIGWALREYSKTEPDAVREFLVHKEQRLSGLSRREATKYL